MAVEHPGGKTDAIAVALLAWYDGAARRLPWRAPPGSQAPVDPYRVWLSEIMLQQTTVAAVGPYFAAFTARWPDVAALAAADDAAVMAAWAGLGYYARARNLLACARIVTTDCGGQFPADEAGLRRLPGIGDYTAAAIASIAFGTRAVVVDANVERVVARLCAIETPLPSARKAIRAAANAFTPDDRAGDFAQAMMDLGATICTPGAPRCLSCPVRDGCRANALGIADSLPVKPAKPAKPHRAGWAWWIERNGAIRLETRPPRGMLGGMRGLPGTEWRTTLPSLPSDAIDTGISVQHVFTHFTLVLRIARRPDDAVPEGGWWAHDDIAAAGLPTLYAKAVRAMAADPTETQDDAL